MAKSIEERLSALRALEAKYEAEIKATNIANNVEVGDGVTISFGRGAKVRNIAGTIVGFKDSTGGRLVGVITSDLDFYRVNVRDVIENAAAAARQAAADVEAEATINIDEQDPVSSSETPADADPLSEA